MASGWFIDDQELEFAPSKDVRKIGRQQKTGVLVDYFPELFGSTANIFSYEIKGYCLDYEAFLLDQIARSADTNIIEIKPHIHQQIFHVGKYAVASLTIDRNKVRYTDAHGLKGVRVLYYTLTLTEIADEGENQNSVDGIKDANEDGLSQDYFKQVLENHDVEFTEQEKSIYSAWFGAFNTELAQ